MGTIGLAHRGHRDFVVDWLEPDESTTARDEGLAERVEVVRARARIGREDELTGTPAGAAPADESDEPETWLAGEPTF